MKDFAEPNQCEESILRYFRKPLDGETGSWYSISDVRDLILYKSQIPPSELPLRNVAQALKALGFNCTRPHYKTRYLAVEITDEEYIVNM